MLVRCRQTTPRKLCPAGTTSSIFSLLNPRDCSWQILLPASTDVPTCSARRCESHTGICRAKHSKSEMSHTDTESMSTERTRLGKVAIYIGTFTGGKAPEKLLASLMYAIAKAQPWCTTPSAASVIKTMHCELAECMQSRNSQNACRLNGTQSCHASA